MNNKEIIFPQNQIFINKLFVWGFLQSKSHYFIKKLTELLENAREIENSVKEVFEKSVTMLPGPEEEDDSFTDPSFG